MDSLKLWNLAVGLGLGLGLGSEDASGDRDTLLRCFLLGLGLDFWGNFLFVCENGGACISIMFLPSPKTTRERSPCQGRNHRTGACRPRSRTRCSSSSESSDCRQRSGRTHCQEHDHHLSCRRQTQTLHPSSHWRRETCLFEFAGHL